MGARFNIQEMDLIDNYLRTADFKFCYNIYVADKAIALFVGPSEKGSKLVYRYH